MYFTIILGQIKPTKWKIARLGTVPFWAKSLEGAPHLASRYIAQKGTVPNRAIFSALLSGDLKNQLDFADFSVLYEKFQVLVIPDFVTQGAVLGILGK